MINKYPGTLIALALLIFGVVLVILAAPIVKAEPAQVVIIVGAFVIGIQQVIGLLVSESNGHRLTKVEVQSAATTAIVEANNTGELNASEPK